MTGKRIWKVGAGLAVAGATLAGLSLGLAYAATHPRRKRLTTDLGELPCEDVTFPSRDGTRLSGWFVAAQDAIGGVALCHGHLSNRSEMVDAARLLHHAGFHTLLFDFRAGGQSEGDLCTVGHMEVGDLLGAVDCLQRRPEMAGLSVGAFGNSMGGAVAIMTAAEDPRILAVATHGAFATLDSAIAQRCRITVGPLAPLMHRQAVWFGRKLWMDLHPRDVSPVGAIGNISPRPVLLIHGKNDMTIRLDDARTLYDAANEPKEILVLPRSWHIWMDSRDRVIYEQTVTRFFREAIAADAPGREHEALD